MRKLLSQPVSDQAMQLLLAYFFCLGLMVFSVMCLSSLPYPDVSNQYLPQTQPDLVSWYGKATYPILKQKFIFILTFLLLPLFSWVAIQLSKKTVKRLSQKTQQELNVLSVCLALPLLFFTFYLSDFILHLSDKVALHTNLACITIGTTCYVFYRLLSPKKSLFRLTHPLIMIAILLPALSYKICNVYSVTSDDAWHLHFDAVFYAMTQVVRGKTLLVDFPFVYGLFPEILNPLFQLIGLSILNYTLVLAMLEVMLLLTLYATLLKIMRCRILIQLCMLSLCLLISRSWYLINTYAFEPYFQYSPIRVLFPAVALYFFAELITRQRFTYRFLALFAFICGIALLWNFDSGIPILESLMLYLATFLFFPATYLHRARAAGLLLYVLGITCCTCSAFFFYLYWKSGFHSIHIAWFIKYPLLLNKLNLMALPIPTDLNPWHAIYAIYVLGIVGALTTWLQGNRKPYWDMIFCVSLLGIGLFSYYISKARPNNLIYVCWPALIVAFLIYDHVLRLVKSRLLPQLYTLYFAPLLFFSVLLSVELLSGLPTFFHYGIQHWQTMLAHQDTPITRNMQFIKHHSPNETETLILGPLQSIYYGELARVSPLNSTSFFEIILKTDFQQYLSSIAQSISRSVFVQLDERGKIPFSLTPSLTHYKLVAISQDNMAYFTRKPPRLATFHLTEQ